MLYLPDCARQVITAAVIAAYPNEGCGLLLGRLETAGDGSQNHRVSEAIALENRWEPEQEPIDPEADDLVPLSSSTATAVASRQGLSQGDPGQPPLTQRRRYAIDPRDWLRVQKAARQVHLDIIGVFHSHPDHPAIPSQCDRRLAWPDYAYVIAAVRADRVMDLQSWLLNSQGQFEPQAIKILAPLTNKGPLMS